MATWRRSKHIWCTAVPVPISKASLHYWNVAAPRNSMFTGKEVQEAEERNNKIVPMVPGVWISAGGG